MFTNILIAAISYLLGSIPFAYILVKKSTGNDISQIGTGNIGAMNSYETTKSRTLGITVMLLDALKGIVSVLIAYLIKPDVTAIALAAIFSVAGHNFSVYMKFKGGRGLATAAGVFMLINPLMVVIWGLMFLAGWFVIKKNVHIASVTATVTTPVMLYYIPQSILDKASLLMQIPASAFLIFGSIVCFIILLKHIEPLIELSKNPDNFKR
jgi:glycerol-3-phosphate acyltransferase PlsY